MNADVQGVVCQFCQQPIREARIEGQTYWATVEDRFHPFACPVPQGSFTETTSQGTHTILTYGMHKPPPP